MTVTAVNSTAVQQNVQARELVGRASPRQASGYGTAIFLSRYSASAQKCGGVQTKMSRNSNSAFARHLRR